MTTLNDAIHMEWLDEIRDVAKARLDYWNEHLRVMGNMRVGAIAHQLSMQPLDSVVMMLAVAIKERAGLMTEPDRFCDPCPIPEDKP